MPGIATPDSAAIGRVVLDGALTIRNVEQIHVRLLEAVDRHANVVVDCAAATDFDLSFIQLVLSARKSARAAGKSLSLDPAATDVLVDVLTRAGLLGAGDGPPFADQLFWFNREADDGEDHSHRR